MGREKLVTMLFINIKREFDYILKSWFLSWINELSIHENFVT